MASGDAQHQSTGAAGEQTGERKGYPVNRVVAILDTDERAGAAVQALRAGGFLEAEIDVASGQATADAMHGHTGRSGLANLAIRIAERLGVSDDEMEVKAHYEQALHDGRFLLLVEAPSDARRDRAAEILRAHGAHTVNFMGRFARTEIVPPSSAERGA